MKSELAIKRDDWFASVEGKRCSDIKTLSRPGGTDKYLRNRLEQAFLAGALANEEVAQDLCDNILKSQ